ncbi:phosphoribosylformylglycinamidine synthase subunit PurL [Candidatus Aerophobetes bacterium]|nr:phosphoribosylformylglycinamidine synthase subunit PurL [Candidatus Aerophobetes bacterium]
MREPEKIDAEIIKDHGLTVEEYEKIKKALKREPNFTELGIFSVMWSEHCSYKSSKLILKKFPTKGSNILVEAGKENAGVVDIGDGLAVVFKMESHNHPSAIEPFQGAATGVGGIIRDIFTMGARPVLLMDSLRFGPVSDPKSRYLLRGVVGGIAFYGNCIGIPTVGGETFFDESYKGNPLVNVLCLGIVKKNSIIKAKAEGEGNTIFYVGSSTGRDGLGGASFASRELTDESHKDRPSVQIGDPFMEKLLLEATLELIRTGVVVGMQDMGAAGLTSSTVETASRGNSGAQIDISRVPRREKGMIPYEVMLSESQERMLVVVKKNKEEEAKKIFKKWDLNAVPIGKVTSDGVFKVKEGEKVVASIPVKSLTDDAPIYLRERAKPKYLEEANNLDLSSLPLPENIEKVFVKILSSPNISSKRWIFEQYDHMVGTNTILLPGHDSAVVRVKETRKAIAVSCDGNGRYCYLDPYEGGKIAVAEAARNVVCVGAKPLAITNCLNFGTPTDPEIFWQFTKCVEGIAIACRELETPVTGGNVSFYNENPQGAIDPTPIVGMLGLINDFSFLCTPWFKKEGDLIILLGNGEKSIGGSEYLQCIHQLKKGRPPELDLTTEKLLQKTCLELIKKGLVNSAHDVSDGGLAICLAECCILNRENLIGATINLERDIDEREDILLFGEVQSQIILSCSPQNFPYIEKIANKNKISLKLLGKVGGENLIIKKEGKVLISKNIKEIHKIWENSLVKEIKI